MTQSSMVDASKSTKIETKALVVVTIEAVAQEKAAGRDHDRVPALILARALGADTRALGRALVIANVNANALILGLALGHQLLVKRPHDLVAARALLWRAINSDLALDRARVRGLEIVPCKRSVTLDRVPTQDQYQAQGLKVIILRTTITVTSM